MTSPKWKFSVSVPYSRLKRAKGKKREREIPRPLSSAHKPRWTYPLPEGNAFLIDVTTLVEYHEIDGFRKIGLRWSGFSSFVRKIFLTVRMLYGLWSNNNDDGFLRCRMLNYSLFLGGFWIFGKSPTFSLLWGFILYKRSFLMLLSNIIVI